MAKIGLTGGFTPLPEGIYVLRVKKVEYNEQFGKLKIVFETKEGKTHTEQFSLLNEKGQPNEGAYNAFSILAKTLLDDFDLEEIDEQDLVGHYVKCSIEHNVVESRNGNGTRTFAHLGYDKQVAYGFDEEEAPAPLPAPTPAGSADLDLDTILGL